MDGGFVSHLECSLTGEHYTAGEIHGLSKAGRPLLVRYDIERISATVTQKQLLIETGGFWRYRAFLPVAHPSNRISLGEVITPLIPLERSALAIGKVLVKDESRLPTGSFKARGLALAVAMAKEFGIDHLAMPTNGNAGAALAAYGSRAGIKTTVFCPDDTPEVNIREIAFQGAQTYRVNGLINDCAKIVSEGISTTGWFDLSTLKEPYRIEGKKTMGLELAEQLGWQLPDVIIYPTGGGTGLIGMWKAFAELQEMGWIQDRLPRMVAVQADGCAPIVKAYHDGEEHAPLWENAQTLAAGIRVPVAVGDFLILRALRQSGGFAIAVSDAAILEAQRSVSHADGVLLCPEGAATYAAYKAALSSGKIASDENVVLFNCATGLKYPLAPVKQRIDKDGPIDYYAF